MSDLVELVERSIAAKRLFCRGEGVLVAVSGGLDSMVLLNLLARLAETNAWRLTVAHFNHQLRGCSSDADEQLVKREAGKLSVPFFVGRADVKKFGREQKLSPEMAARELRHSFLARVANERKLKKIALAHHADDQVELFFVRLLRGAGGEGGAGMKWLGPSPKDAKILLARPLLNQPKSVLEAYAKQECVLFREDATNFEVEIQRNRIRHELLPMLAQKFQPSLQQVVLRQMEIVGSEAELVTQLAQKWLTAKRRKSFNKLPVALQRRCVQLQLITLGVATNFDLIEQLRNRADSTVSVNAKIAICRNATGSLKIVQPNKASFNGQTIKIRLQGRAGDIVFGDVQVNWVLKNSADGPFQPPKRRLNLESFDADKLGADIVLRHWRAGDRFHPIGLPKPVKLQDLFTNAKIPRERRHRLLVGTTVKGVLFWVEGLRLGEGFKLDKKTRNQLIWRWKRVW